MGNGERRFLLVKWVREQDLRAVNANSLRRLGRLRRSRKA
jgi:hypothetical protein